MECLKGRRNVCNKKKGGRWSGQEDLNLCPFRDQCNIFKELQEHKISVHSELIDLLR
jgi:hypothetical protein